MSHPTHLTVNLGMLLFMLAIEAAMIVVLIVSLRMQYKNLQRFKK